MGRRHCLTSLFLFLQAQSHTHRADRVDTLDSVPGFADPKAAARGRAPGARRRGGARAGRACGARRVVGGGGALRGSPGPAEKGGKRRSRPSSPQAWKPPARRGGRAVLPHAPEPGDPWREPCRLPTSPKTGFHRRPGNRPRCNSLLLAGRPPRPQFTSAG